MARLLGIDYGDVRIGLALSDPTGTVASALCTLERDAAAPERICAAAAEQEVSRIVVGLPRNMDGSYGPASQKVRAFIEQLQALTSVPVVEWDERLSTVSAHHVLREAGLNSRRRKGVVDRVAAQIILQNYLDAAG